MNKIKRYLSLMLIGFVVGALLGGSIALIANLVSAQMSVSSLENQAVMISNNLN